MYKVLIVQQVIPNYRIEFFRSLYHELKQNNIELTLIYGDRSDSYKSGQGELNIEFGEYVKNHYFKIFGTYLCYQPIIHKINQYDLIIVEQANKLVLNYFLIILKHFMKFRLGFWGHARNLLINNNHWKNKISSLYIKKSDWWWAYTKGVKEFLVTSGFPSSKISVVQNSFNTTGLKECLLNIDNSEIIKLKEELEIIGNNIAIYCGGFYSEKKIEFLLDCCEQIRNEIPDFHMIFIGKGPDLDKIINSSKRNNWIHYEGLKFGKDKVKYFKIAKFQLIPGAVGLNVIDSFALNTPLITTYSNNHGPEFEYIENDKNGIITNNTKRDYSRKVIELMKTDTNLNLINECNKSSHIFTLDKMIQNFKIGIIKCLNQKNFE